MSLIVNEFLAPDAVALGRLVLSIQRPEQDFFAPSPSMAPTSENKSQVQYQSFQETLKRVQSCKLAACLTKLLSLSNRGSNSHSTAIQASSCMTYTLKNSGDYFAQLCEDKAARKWLEKAFHKNHDVYLVVGIKTLTDANVVLKNEAKRDADVKSQAPVDASLFSGDVPASLGVMGASGSKIDSTLIDSKFGVPGEQVYAAQFRKVEFKLFSKKTIDNAFLTQGNRWTIYPSGRVWPFLGLSPVEIQIKDVALVESGLDYVLELEARTEGLLIHMRHLLMPKTPGRIESIACWAKQSIHHLQL